MPESEACSRGEDSGLGLGRLKMEGGYREKQLAKGELAALRMASDLHTISARRTLRAMVSDRLRGVTSGERELRSEMRRVWT